MAVADVTVAEAVENAQAGSGGFCERGGGYGCC